MPLSLSKGVYIFDIEADNLLEEATKIHCLSVGKVLKSGELRITTTTDYEEMKDFFLNKEITKVGHNIIRYDCLVAEKILGIKVPTSCLIDTLPLSWYLSPGRLKHGLESYGLEYDTEKVAIEDWKNLTEEEYIIRCEQDVRINYALWKDQKAYLLKLYKDEEEAIAIIKYLNFKSICVRDQEEIGIRFDMDRAKAALEKLEKEREEKIVVLAEAMPPEDVMATKTVPKEMYKKDGTFTTMWLKWLDFKREYGVPDDWNEPSVKYVKSTKPGNPGSTVQIKAWLDSLGWEPCTYAYNRNKETGEVKQVPQVYNKDTGEITPSVFRLIEKEPSLEILNGLGKLKHRIGLLGGLIESCKLQEDGTYRIYPSISGYTNTLRLQHKTVVNLPKVGLYLGSDIRGCFIRNDENSLLCGADLSNIESVTRNHYIKPLDPDYVATMERDDFDAHIDIAILAKMMSKEDGEWYVETSRKVDAGEYHIEDEEEKARFKALKKIRGAAKGANFSCTYGVGKTTLARNVGMSENDAQKLIKTYWSRNWAVKEFANSCTVKTIGDQRWIQNPVSKFWLSLRSDKDRFSTVNQSTAVFCLDIWLANVRKLGVVVQYQCHDEILFSLPAGEEASIRELLKESMRLANEQLNLNVTISMAPAFGINYAETH